MKRVMIVDDSFFMRKMIKTYLERAGYTVVGEAANGEDAVGLYQKCRPDIVTLDITLPGMNGIDTLKQIIRADSEAKVVMVSAMGQEALVRESVLSGAKNFIVKPFKEHQLAATLDRIRKASAHEE